MKLGEQISERPTIDDPLSGYRMFDIAQLTQFIQKFPCPTWATCQHEGYDVTEVRAGLASSLKFVCDELQWWTEPTEHCWREHQRALP